MTLTIGSWILIGIVGLIGLGIALYLFCCYDHHIIAGICTTAATILLCVLIALGLSWYHTSTAAGIRHMKDYESNLSNGLEREIIITAEDGREIFYYEGKVDIETKHDGNANYILFESEEGQRYIIYYGVQDTVMIIEKAGN